MPLRDNHEQIFILLIAAHQLQLDVILPYVSAP